MNHHLRISALTKELVRSILQEPSNFKEKVNNPLKKPDLTESYPAFILSEAEGKVDCHFIGKSCSKIGLTLDNINNYQSNDVQFNLTNGSILQTVAFCKKSHLSNTHFGDIVNHLSLGKFDFDRWSINNNVEVLTKEVRKFQRLPFQRDPLEEAKKKKEKKKREKIKLENNGAPKYHIIISCLEIKTILLNETL